MVSGIVSKVVLLFDNLAAAGFTYQVPRWRLVAEIKRVNGSLTDRAVARFLKTMIELGYIRQVGFSNIFELCVSVDQPFVFHKPHGVVVEVGEE